MTPLIARILRRVRRGPDTSTERGLRGVALLETLLALAVGGIILGSSIYGMRAYTEGVQVQAAGGTMSRLIAAGEEYVDDNLEALRTNAPQTLPGSVLEPYFGNNLGSDAFGSTFVLTTRTYPITVPARGGAGTTTIQGLQLLITAQGGDAVLDLRPDLRARIANIAGAGGGFISRGGQTCLDGSGTVRPAGDVCGAFGSYSFDAADWPAISFANATHVGLVTRGDAALYDDELVRYDIGDPDLNRMNTDLDFAPGGANIVLNGNNVENAGTVGTGDVQFTGTDGRLTASGTIRLDSARVTANDIQFNGANGRVGAANSISLDTPTTNANNIAADDISARRGWFANGVQVGTNAGGCNGGAAGTTRFEPGRRQMQYCDGSRWQYFGGFDWDRNCRSIYTECRAQCRSDEYLVNMTVSDEGQYPDMGYVRPGWGGRLEIDPCGGTRGWILCCRSG